MDFVVNMAIKKYYLPLLSTKKIKNKNNIENLITKEIINTKKNLMINLIKRKDLLTRKYPKKPIRCWKCKQQGHYATKCPMKNQIKKIRNRFRIKTTIIQKLFKQTLKKILVTIQIMKI